MVKVDQIIPRACGVDVSVPTIRTVQKTVEVLLQLPVFDLVVNVPVVDCVRISVSRHSDSKVQKTIKSAQAQYLGKIVCSWK